MRTLERSALTDIQRRLLEAAEGASRTANCRYSGYPVGAALLIENPDGRHVVTGNNYETLNYYSVCAEKSAMIRAFADYSWTDDQGELRRPKVLAVGVYCAVGGTPQQPCGDCRQTLQEVNPDIQVIAAAGPARLDGEHDGRATVTTIRELLPHSFELRYLINESYGPEHPMADDEGLEDFVVHLPRAATLSCDRDQREALLRGVEGMLLVGSPLRARKVAELAHQKYGALPVDEACYCDLTVPGRDESGREYAIYVVAPPGGPKIAVASHGIGASGVEVLMSELPAAIALAQGGTPPTIRGVIRAGTRGTLTRVPLGCTALSTRSCDEHLDTLDAHEGLLDKLRAAAAELGMTRFPDRAIDDPDTVWPERATDALVEGMGLSATYFWSGQARPLYRPHNPMSPEAAETDRRDRARTLAGWQRFGVRWIEMEDYAVHHFAALCGYPSATLGAVIAHRQAADGTYQLDYNKDALRASEMIPTELALRAFGIK